MKKILPLAALLLSLLYGCEKMPGNSCPPPERFTITTNSPIQEGWPLTLTAPNDMGYLYKWSGPNGFKVEYTYYASDAYKQGKIATAFADSGVYKLQMIDADGCVAYQGSAFVQIVPASGAPCTVPDNSSTTSVIGVGGDTYRPSFGNNRIDGYGTGESIYFIFDGDQSPIPGLYQSSGTIARDSKTVAVYIRSGFYQFVSSGQDVYVTKVNGKLQISFCKHTLSNPVNSSPIMVSAKLVEP